MTLGKDSGLISPPSAYSPEMDERNRELIRHFRNVLSVIRALARQTMEGERQEGCDRLAARIDALARAQSALLRDIAAGADLDSLVRDELMTFGIRPEWPVQVEGPEVRLKARAAGLVALLIHELALGIVATPSAKLAVLWREREDGSLKLIWRDQSSGGCDCGWLTRAFSYELRSSLREEDHGAGRQWVADLPSANLIR
ncbi:two-component sensor histidine kinase [Sphingomonas zeicaulis]|uniref:HWE histidine kinase domain-containing protein n=1 Tax=Sphingomonas zeicaulis TaxID=1632740 RepID=UPI003D252EDE